MNGTREEARAWARAAAACAERASAEVAIVPSHPLLGVAREALGEQSKVALGAQDCHPDAKGAHTGGVAASMLAQVGCRYVLCGHSETRRERSLSDATVGACAARAAEAGLVPVVCVGETSAERDAGRAREVVLRQLAAALRELPRPRTAIEVAYEPVWAIGTGRNATPDQAQEAHGWIRAALDAEGFPGARILYGGSVTYGNVAGFLSRPGVDGVLVGGQSLDPEAFAAIVSAADGTLDRARPATPGARP